MKKFLLSIFALMLAVFSVQAEDYSYTLAKGDGTKFGDVTWNEVEWNISADNTSYCQWDGSTSKGYQFGSSKQSCKTLTLSTSGIEGTITKIVVNTSGASSINASLTVSVGGIQYGSSTKLTTSATDYTFTGSASGEIKLSYTQTSSKALYIKSIAVTYTTGTGEGGGETVDTAIPPTFTNSGNFVGSTMVEIENNDPTATLYYSVDGVEYKEYHEFEIEETTTVSAYAQIGDNEETRCAPVTATYTRVAATPEIGFDGDASAFENEIDVFVSTENDTPVYYTLDGSTPDAKSTLYEAPLTIKANATLKVIAIEDGGYKSGVVSQVFKKAAINSGSYATLVEDVTELSAEDQIVIVATDSNNALSITQNNNNRSQTDILKKGSDVELNDNVQVITLEEGIVDGTFAFNVGTGYLYAASSSSNYLRTQTTNNENGSWDIKIADGVATIIAKGSNTRNYLQYNKTSSLFSCYAEDKPQANLSIYKVNASTFEAYTLTVSKAGWATLFLDYAVEIPEGVTCYTVAEVNSEKVTLASVTGILPANTAVIVEAKEGEYTFEPTKDNNENTIKNLMCGTTNNEYIEEDAYVLGNVEGVALYKAEKAGGVWLNNANKAYLPAEYAALSTSLRFDFGGTTAVEEVETEAAETVIYDLTGRRVNEITKAGVYVVNGKKILVK